MQIGTKKTLENNLALFCKVENAHILPIISTLRHLPFGETLESVQQKT